ncbi:MAG: glycosyltransferase family 2 protein, partial [Pseudanabaena sp.]
MRLSIILPCLNEIRHGYLDRILNNLVNQLVPPNCEKEIIAVVSASDDGTDLVLENYAARSPEIQVVRSLAKIAPKDSMMELPPVQGIL